MKLNKESRKIIEQSLLSQANMLLGAVDSLSWKYEGENLNDIPKEEIQKELGKLNETIEFLEKEIGAAKFQLPNVRYPEFTKKIISKIEEMLNSLYKTKEIMEEGVKDGSSSEDK